MSTKIQVQLLVWVDDELLLINADTFISYNYSQSWRCPGVCVILLSIFISLCLMEHISEQCQEIVKDNNCSSVREI